MRPLPRSVRAAAVLSALASASACADGTGLNFAGDVVAPPEPILFVSTVPGDSGGMYAMRDVFRMDRSGAVTNLTQHPDDVYRSFSLAPTGRRVAFNSTRTGCQAIWAMNTDGSDLVQLTGTGTYGYDRCNYMPRYSPDGRYIAFQSTREQNFSAYVMNADGTDPHSVSGSVRSDTLRAYPQGWSPDGRVVVSVIGPMSDDASRTYLVNASSGQATRLLPRDGDHSPAWSRDHGRIAFISNRDGSDRVYVMDADGSDVRRLSPLTSGDDALNYTWGYWNNDYNPWSPDGSRIAFTVSGDGIHGVYVMNADGTGLRRLSAEGASGEFNGWSSDGEWLAFLSNEAGPTDAYVIRPDGTGKTNLTPGPTNESGVLWLLSQQ